MAVDDPAWVIVGYPRFAPQIVHIITLNELVEDLAIRQFAFGRKCTASRRSTR